MKKSIPTKKDNLSVTQKQEKFAELQKSLTKTFGQGVLRKANEVMGADEKYQVISSGSISLDNATGIGGIPVGRITEIAGEEHAGKTTLALSISANAQKMGKTVVYIDNEHTLDPAWAKKLGVDWDNFFISQADNLDDCFQVMSALLQSDSVDVVILDSLTSLPLKATTDVKNSETSGLELSQTEHLRRANLITKFFQNNQHFIAENDKTVVIINQIREKVGGQGGMNGQPVTYTPGGRGTKHAASLRIFLKTSNVYSNTLKGYSERGANFEIKKNKMAVPYTKGRVIYTKDGLDVKTDLLELGKTSGAYDVRGAWVYPSLILQKELGLQEKYNGVNAMTSALFCTESSTEAFINLFRKEYLGKSVILDDSEEISIPDYDDEIDTN